MIDLFDFEAIRVANPLMTFLESRGVTLRWVSNYYQGKCPFHQEQKGTSLVVYPDDQRWRCFGACGRGGDVVDATAILNGLSIKEAVQRLA
jgi:DNA primase